AKAEVRIVESVHQLAHVLDSFAQLRGVIGKALWRKIAREQRLVHRVASHRTALEREHDAGRKHRVEKTIRVAHEQETFDTAVARVKREFAGDIERSELRAAGDVFLDPQVLFDLAFENLFRLFHAITRELFALGDDSDTDDVVVQRDVQEPALLEHER